MSQLKYWDGSAWSPAVIGAQGATGATGPSATSENVLIQSGTFTSQSPFILDGIFTNAYADYKIKLKITSATSLATVSFQYRYLGTTYTASIYNYQYISAITNSAGALSSSSQPSILLCNQMTSANFPQTPIELNIYSPLSASVYTTSKHSSFVTGSTYATLHTFAHHSSGINGPLPADGISFTPSTGTISGSYRLYGVN